MRADQAVVAAGLADTRSRAQTLIIAGEIWLGSTRIAKPAQVIAEHDLPRLELRSPNAGYVGRGAQKLAPALDAAQWDLAGHTCLDVGASTGAFSELLLDRGAAGVWAVDVGYGQLHPRLRNDARVTVRERCNFRNWDSPAEAAPPFAFAVMDVSFISVRLLLAPLFAALMPGGRALVLVKPQFELGREAVGRGGVVRDPDAPLRARDLVAAAAREQGFAIGIDCAAGVEGRRGNREWFLELIRPDTVAAEA